MGANIIQFLEIISLNSLACTVKFLGRSSRWLLFILWVSRLKLDFHVCIYNWNSFFILYFLRVSVACIEHWSSRVWAPRTIVKTSTCTTVKCLRRFLKRWHRLIVWVTRLKLDAGVQVENSFLTVYLLTVLHVLKHEWKPLLPPRSNAVRSYMFHWSVRFPLDHLPLGGNMGKNV